jgi:lactoylglutathione lyase
MRLNHLHLMVEDVQASAAFLATYFGMTALPGGRERLAVMTDGGGMILTLMQGRDHSYPRNFHIGFAQPSHAAVNQLRERMLEDGHSPSAPALAHAWSFYVTAPGGIMIEVLAPADAA